MVMATELLSAGEGQEVIMDGMSEAFGFPVGFGAVQQMPEDAD